MDGAVRVSTFAYSEQTCSCLAINHIHGKGECDEPPRTMGGICVTCQYADTFTGEPVTITEQIEAAVKAPLTQPMFPTLPPVGEVRITDPVTGGMKGQKPARFDLLPGDALALVAEHFGKGGAKYEDRNWEKGYAWGLCFAALQRHVWAFWQGEDIDAETGSLHLTAAAWHALVLLTFATRGIGTDDRP